MSKNNTDVLADAIHATAADDVGHDATSGSKHADATAREQMMHMMMLVMMLLMLMLRAWEPMTPMMMLRSANILATNVLP